MLLQLQSTAPYLKSATKMSIILKTFAKLPANPHHRITNSRKYQPEGVIEHIIAAYAVRKQLEDLGVIHWPLLLVDL